MEKKKVERSSSYPSLSLDDALTKLTQLKDSMGLNGEYKRETVASGIGYSTITGTSARAVAALTQYGFLDREKDIYQISSLGRRYLMPTTENDTFTAIREAALSPKLFKQIYDEYQGQVLPKLIVNILANKYGVQPKVGPTVVKLFESAMTSAQLLEPSGRLTPYNTVESGELNTTAEQASVEGALVQSQIETSTPATVTASLDINSEKPFNEQGVNHSGNGWALTVRVKSSHQLPPEVRKAVRELLESADSAADQFYNLEQKEE
jgi:hypothetical protein